ncbi:MAG TPA: hypothetical protein VE110_04285 [Gemmatimonadaceae bacterium]|jgi:hypothetical protein|nr:hypothetical protein [Gemmatimonadaceae bacterium]
MAQLKKKKGPENKSSTRERIQLAAIGMEAEFAVVMDGVQVKPEDAFGSPRRIIREKMMHRKGRSYHLPTGGAVYFDTGVVEVATPVIEIERGCAARAGRSLWEAILFVRQELDAWEQAHDTDVQLAGFSTHYNISFEVPRQEQGSTRTVEQLAYLLTYILPVPVMLLAANRRSTGIGVRPRGDRIEVTADFTPDAPLMIATATLIVGIVREVMTWPSYEIGVLDTIDIPVIKGFRPMPHTTRKGWLARFDCYPDNPFLADIDRERWATTDGRSLSLREIAGLVTKHFWPYIRRLSDPFTLRLIGSVMKGRAPSLLDLDDRPPGYEDVGRLCTWDNLFPERVLPRSQYERVLIRAISGDKLHMDGEWYTPTGMRGWSRVVFRKKADNSRHIFSLDYLLDHLREWERPYRTTRGSDGGRPARHERDRSARA